ncbi:Xylose isomerase-like TIM barrel [Pseudobythopirellula maris]|uniref:Xylose isomerase-like TIM barrel n=1 Tax=Pseudobythopirellula maris TaxID=2527991 RepID=A0A5C5ZLD8_9BACT|nr:sugar phosphate isomerase/epimerase family protein [Pseudobythopirellula maris]TWT87253.1 Xylose isomerase-like TIM barrel [Pseudobythopirellula maris]
MTTPQESQDDWPLGVFASVDAGFGVRLDVAKALGVPTMHLHAPHETPPTRQAAEAFRRRVDELGLRVTVVFAGFDGESYADIPTVERTVGLAPETTRSSRLAELKAIIDYTQMLGVAATGLHLGFVPHDPADPQFDALMRATREACDYAAGRSVSIHLETGQEPAGVLLEFLDAVERPNLFVNFDPANMILYGCGKPLEALEQIAPHVRSVHCKDARWSDLPGETWGEETPLGEGDVDFGAFLALLKKIGYRGPLTIEREISQEPERQSEEIAHAAELLTRLKTELFTN